MTHLPQTWSFWKSHWYNFHVPITPFHCAKFLKNSWSGSRVIRMCHFWAQNGPFATNKNFLGKIFDIIFIYLLVPFTVQNLKKFLQQIQSYEDVPFFGPKWLICPNYNFFRKPVHKPCSFHSCLSIFQKSNSDINLLMKYFQLKNTEISLAENHFWP